MKRYLLVAITLLFVCANASLKEDFARMDLEQDQLLSDMRSSIGQSSDDNAEDGIIE